MVDLYESHNSLAHLIINRVEDRPEFEGLEIPQLFEREHKFDVAALMEDGMARKEAEGHVNSLVGKQIDDAVAFLNTSVPVEHYVEEWQETESDKIFTKEVAQALVEMSFTNNNERARITANICGKPNAYNKYLRTVSRQLKKNTSVFLAQVLGAAICEWQDFHNVYKEINPARARDRTTKKLVQRNIMLELMERNRQYLDVARALSYAFIDSRIFAIKPDSFFSQDDQNGMIGFAFGLATCHIGYFSRPQYQKRDALYAMLTGRTIDEIRQFGLNFSDHSPEEAIASIDQQMRVESILFKRLMLGYDNLRHTSDKEEYESSTLALRLQMLEKGKDFAEKGLEAAKAQITRMERDAGNVASRHDGIGYERARKEYQGGAKSAKDEAAQSRKDLRTALARIKELESSVADLATEREDLVGRLDVLRSTGSEPNVLGYMEIDPQIASYETDTRMGRYVRDARDRITRGVAMIKPMQKAAAKNAGHVNALRRWPEHDSFLRMDVVDSYRAILALVESGDAPKYRLLEIMNHDDYMRFCSQSLKRH